MDKPKCQFCIQTNLLGTNLFQNFESISRSLIQLRIVNVRQTCLGCNYYTNTLIELYKYPVIKWEKDFLLILLGTKNNPQ